MALRRVAAERRIEDAERRIAKLEEFDAAWTELDEMTMAALKASELTSEQINAFDETRARASRLLPEVRRSFSYTTLHRTQFGQAEQLDIFGFTLEQLPHLGSFTDYLSGDQYKARFFEMRPRARSQIEQAKGRLEMEIADLETGADYIDELEEQAKRAGVTGFTTHLSRAEEHLTSDESKDVIHNARRALERAVTEIGNKVADDARQRRFRDALSLLVDKGLLDEASSRSIGTPSIGLWGWLSEVGTHDEDSPAEDFTPQVAHARLAIERTRAVIEFLLDLYVSYRESVTAQSDK